MEGNRRGFGTSQTENSSPALRVNLSAQLLLQEKDTLVKTLKVQEDEIRSKDEEIRQLKRLCGINKVNKNINPYHVDVLKQCGISFSSIL